MPIPTNRFILLGHQLGDAIDENVLVVNCGDEGYAREELGELGAAFLCADLGITPEVREDHADYLGHWLNVLKEDKPAIFSAAAHAQRAADYLAGLQQSAQRQEAESAAA